jgi:uncharacterized protein (DUF58 family)
MLPREILRQVRRLQLRARRAVEDVLGGEYHSVFKGAGIAFEEVRAYQPGDEVRSIDWNVTARLGQPYVKRYIEERERTLMLVVDVSGSLDFGTQQRSKREVAAELAAVLAFSAASNNDRVGLVQFSDHVEHFLPPRKGTRHILRLIRDVLFFEPTRRGTRLGDGLDHVNRLLRRRAIVFLLSDFLTDEDLRRPLQRTAQRHELIALRLADPREEVLPDVGLVEFADAETGRRLLVDTSNARLREDYHRAAQQRLLDLRQLLAVSGIELVEAGTDGRHLDALIRFFRQRERRLRGGRS